MTIASVDDYFASVKQVLELQRSGSRTTIATDWYTGFDLAGQPGAGSLTPSANTGVEPDDTLTGAPAINSFAGGATGYLTRVAFSCSVACRLALFDRLFYSGGFNSNGTVTQTGGDYSDRLPGSDASGIELWLECAVAGTPGTLTVTYTNSLGVSGHTAVLTPGVMTVGRCIQFPLQAGDAGVQSVQSVQTASHTSGTYNIMALRPLWQSYVPITNGGDIHDQFKTGAPQVFDTSSLLLLHAPTSTTIGITEMSIEIASK
jgi:hypothetical protein